MAYLLEKRKSQRRCWQGQEQPTSAQRQFRTIAHLLLGEGRRKRQPSIRQIHSSFVALLSWVRYSRRGVSRGWKCFKRQQAALIQKLYWVFSFKKKRKEKDKTRQKRNFSLTRTRTTSLEANTDHHYTEWSFVMRSREGH